MSYVYFGRVQERVLVLSILVNQMDEYNLTEEYADKINEYVLNNIAFAVSDK